MKTTVREAAGGVQIVDLKGKITIGAGDVQLRETINHLVEGGKKNIMINMNDVTTIDSSGIGELVGCYTSVTNKGGKLKLLHLPPKINDVLTVTQLITVFDVYESEPEAVASFAEAGVLRSCGRAAGRGSPGRRGPSSVGAGVVARPAGAGGPRSGALPRDRGGRSLAGQAPAAARGAGGGRDGRGSVARRDGGCGCPRVPPRGLPRP